MSPTKANHQRLLNLVTTACLFMGISTIAVLLRPKPILSAERIVTFVGPLQLAISVDDLETFAEQGQANSDLALITNRLDEATKVQLRELLQQRFDIEPAFLARYARLPIAEEILNKIGKAVKISPGVNGFYGMRAAAILSAADEEEGLTVINFLRHFPTKDIYLDSDYLIQIGRDLAKLSSYQKAVVTEIIQQSEAEAQNSRLDVSQLEDLSQPGPWQVSKQTMSFEVDSLRSINIGLASSYTLDFDLYLPQDNPDPAPLIIITQGFGATPDTYGYVAQQLASFGYAVASIEHHGTNLAQRMASPNRELSGWINPAEFISRPLDVTYLLDELENLTAQDPQWAAKLNLEQVGVFGYSFGGYSALAIAGAEINQPRLAAECSQDDLNPVFSFYFQCQAQHLPPISFQLRDPRIKAVFAVYPLTNPIFGPEGMATLEIPTMIWSSSKDTTVPPVQNQIHPFFWLETPERYFTLLDPGTHFSTVEQVGLEGMPALDSSNQLNGQSAIAYDYLKTMSVAFFNYHLRELAEYKPYLTAAHTKKMSQEADIRLYLTQSLQPEQLETAYGKKPPFPLLPNPVTVAKAPREESILEEIERTGVLKVAVRSDAKPFGFLEENANWSGYCASFINSLEQHLEIALNRPGGIQVVKLPSNVSNRYQLVQQDQVHLECGPNSIRNDIEDLTFSQPFFATGTKFLVSSDWAEQVGKIADLADFTIGVVRNTTTEKFIEAKYPTAEKMYFEGENAIARAVGALQNKSIDAFASSSILSSQEIERQGLTSGDYLLFPQQPLTCDYYGILLPDNDRQWQDMINGFLKSKNLEQFSNQWFSQLPAEVLLNVDSCRATNAFMTR
ncbi:putative dienelactone hydrolase [Xenococcus sp. PCC 7305]|uniref:alpha/beta hydrolase n=1 Tax=Xenococcus sp. PCC 7305 TaxID=102125 RepID=UPI0002ABF98F|nr:alpha/beta hydrolase [Xenococcus sp. PCC 7305]ELS01026.1 putative dienelactone hydrolase [Xenococcus sp. PCC 7305]